MTTSKNEEFAKNLHQRKNEASTIRRFVLITFLVGFVLASIGILYTFNYVNAALNPVDPSNKQKVEVEIPTNSGSTTISSILEEKGIIKNAKVYKYYLKFKNITGLQAGSYEFSPSMTLDQITEIMTSGAIIQEEVKLRFTIPEGRNLEQIAAIMADKTIPPGSQEEILEQLNDREFIEKMMERHPTLLSAVILDPNVRYPLEGYLFPATYSFGVANPSVEEMVEKMLDKTEEVIGGYREGMGDLWTDRWTVHELLTMASIIEGEANAVTNRQKVAAVFINRLDINMRLQTDTTINYIMRDTKEKITLEDLQVASPYNTYIHHGLMPGPINSPGDASILAVINPDLEETALFFLTKADGEAIFAHTNEEHERNKAQYLK